MKFNDYANFGLLFESEVQKKLEVNIRPELAKQTMQVLDTNTGSELVKFIIKRALKGTPGQKINIKKVGTLEGYKMDPDVFRQLMQIQAGDVGPGEVLLSLLIGQWSGGTGGNYDITIDDIGPAEIKYLGPFAHSTNVPMGSAYKKRIADTDFQKVIDKVGQLVKKDPNILKNKLEPGEIDHFLTNTLDQIFVYDENLSTQSLRLIGRLLRNSETQGSKDFSSRGITFKRLTNAMESAIKDGIGDAKYILFLGERSDPNNEGQVLEGQYYLMPKEDIKYYMFYRIYKNERIKIAPFATEREFFEKTINEETLNEMPVKKKYSTTSNIDYKNLSPDHIYSGQGFEVWRDGEQFIEVDQNGATYTYGYFIGKTLVSAMEIAKNKFPTGELNLQGYSVLLVATDPKFRNKGYGSKLYAYVIKKHKVLFSDWQIYENAYSLYERIIPKISYPFNYHVKENKYLIFDPDDDDNPNSLFVSFDKDLDYTKLPKAAE